MRSFYSSTFEEFLEKNKNEIIGIIATNNGFDLNDLQKNTWLYEIDLLQGTLSNFPKDSKIIFEYVIPRIGKRIDNVLLINNIVFLLEFKVGETTYNHYAIDQVLDYALDLKNFHKESHNKLIVPILICSEADNNVNQISIYEDKIVSPLLCNKNNLKDNILHILNKFTEESFDYNGWENSIYMPTPTIIEAAQALYANHNVEDIARSDAGAYNLSITTQKINEIIDYSKANNRKSICFITGVPGAGKTLAGINIANERHKFEENEHAVFLSGNFPLVDVLQEALARDEKARNNITKQEALRRVSAFIQIIHHYRDAYVGNDDIPTEKVAIFDEAQRAWTKDQIANFMARKKGVPNFEYSEPEFLISTLDRHQDWAVIICLVGGGQEINTGEAGLIEWFNSLKRSFKHWDVYVSNMIMDHEYTRGQPLLQLTGGLNIRIEEKLHLATSIRSFRSEHVSLFVKHLLDNDIEKAKDVLSTLDQYPIRITRNLEAAKLWVKSKARGSERYGLLASSKALRLKAVGIFVKNELSAPSYFLNDKDDVRSSYYLEDCATEFDVQGLELDWSIVAWDADFRYNGHDWTYNNFNGSKWNHINDETNKLYLKNAYRVLLTRARQGMIIYIPEGNGADFTRVPSFYDYTYNLLKNIGIEEI
ncbi:MAG: DUF2075 domain-containing protein [Clostridiales bacterium]|nr:DUF2075 domain-containing protein [Clostridiales bacterium]